MDFSFRCVAAVLPAIATVDVVDRRQFLNVRKDVLPMVSITSFIIFFTGGYYFRLFIFIISYLNYYKGRNQLAINGSLGENGLVVLRRVAEREPFKEQETVYLQNGEEKNVRPTFKLKQKFATRIHVQVINSIRLISKARLISAVFSDTSYH